MSHQKKTKSEASFEDLRTIQNLVKKIGKGKLGELIKVLGTETLIRADDTIEAGKLPERIVPKIMILKEISPNRSFSVLVDPGNAPSALIAELFIWLDALYRSLGGSGLKIADQKVYVMAGQEV